MILNKKQFRSGIKKIIIAVSLAFSGPVIFVIGAQEFIIQLLGGIMMIASFLFGVVGLKSILASLFEKPNE